MLQHISLNLWARHNGMIFHENIPDEKLKIYYEWVETMRSEIEEYNLELEEIRLDSYRKQGLGFVKYRPHRGGLAEAMQGYKEFVTVQEMKQYIYRDNFFNDIPMFDIDDIVISDPQGDDDRIGWKDWRYICVKQYGNVQYDIPQCIGMCSIVERIHKED